MRTRKVSAAAAAGLVASAVAFAPPAPANATTYPITTWVSIMTRPSGSGLGPVVLDVKDGSLDNGATVQLWLLAMNAQQYWTISQTGTQNGHPTYMLKNKKSGRCLDMKNDGAVGNGTRVQQWDCNGTANQIWYTVQVDQGGSYKDWVWLVNLQSNLCLDATGASNNNGTPLQVWQCTRVWNQRFNIS
ncbi:UNVERIFIED_ORG: hypothetical protein FHR35_009246 [Microbispora rosea subsp. rosea]